MKLLAMTFTLILFLTACENVLPRGKVVEVDRGDVVMVPTTFSDSYSQAIKLRVLGVRCFDPYSNRLVDAYYGSLAKKFTEKWCDNKYVQLERPLKSGSVTVRRLGFVRDYETNEYLHEALLKAGLARSDFQGRNYGEKNKIIIDLEKEAMNAKIGIWSTKLPAEHVMRAEVNDSKSLLKKFSNTLVDTVSRRAPPITNLKPIPVNIEAVKKPKAQLSRTLVTESVTKIHQRYVTWSKASQVEKIATAKTLRNDLRLSKIMLIDLLDEQGDKLTKLQTSNLHKTKDDLSRLMKELKNFIKNN